MDVGRVTGAAKRRRERRLRSMLRHERQTVAMELAAALHHSRDVGPGTHVGLRAQKTASSGGRRPGVLKEPEPPNVVDRVQRHTVEQRIELTPLVQILDAPVPQKVEQLLEVLRRLDIEVPAQVIEVPQISQDSIRERLVDCDLRHPQMAEQLMEVPTVLPLALLQQQSAEQTVDIPVPHGDLQGFLPGQFSTASSSHSPDAENEAGPPHSGSALPPHSSPWTPPAYDVSMCRVEEQVKRWQETRQQASESLERARLLLDQASKRRKKKKRRKGRLPKSSSHSLLRRARRRHLAVAMSGFAGYSSSCSVLFCCWQPQDARHHGRYVPCCEEAAPVVVAGQGVRYLGRYGTEGQLCCYCGRARCLFRLWRRHRQWHVLCWFVAGSISRAVFSLVGRPMMLCIMSGLDQKGFFRFVSVICVVLSSTADTCGASVYGVFHFLRLLVGYGSTGRFSTCSFSAFAWFNCEYKFMRQSTWLVFLVTMHLALYSFVVLRPLMLDIMAGLDQKDNFLRGLLAFPQVQLLDEVVVPVVCTTNAFFQLHITVDVPLVQLIIKAIYIPVAAQRQVSMVLLFSRPSRFHSCSSSTRS